MGMSLNPVRRRQVAQMFSSYVPPALVEVMARNPQAYSMAATEKELTVLFINIREFSSIAERLSPSELAEWINIYLSTVSQVICNDYNGTLDKYMGDAVMAFWGAPVADDAHAEHAVDAAMQIRYEVEQLNYQFRRRGWPAIGISMGINTGRMRVGDMGSGIRRAYTVMGDAVNIAAQLQTLTREYGTDVLMGKDTAQAPVGLGPVARWTACASLAGARPSNCTNPWARKPSCLRSGSTNWRCGSRCSNITAPSIGHKPSRGSTPCCAITRAATCMRSIRNV